MASRRGMFDETFEGVVRAIGRSLERYGFVRRGRILRKVVGTNCGIIEFQRSTTSTLSRISFTINLGLAYGDLLEGEGVTVQSARTIDAHLRQRAGMFLPGQPDRWWEVSESTNCEALVEELTRLLTTLGVPFIERYLNIKEAIALWESGQSPGLTDQQRLWILRRLKRD